jgi:pyruvate ferredoxin oxidoreductase alpha subunit/oxalate oxidoreductase subunit alpha
MVCQDGYFVSHISGEVELPDSEQVEAFLPPYKLPYALDPRRPVSHGAQIMPEQGPPLQLSRARAMEDAVPVMREVTDSFGEIFGRRYPHFIEGYRLDDAEIAFFVQGAHATTAKSAVDHLRDQGVKIGLARLLWFRPFPTEDAQQLLSHLKAVGVVETNLGLGGATSGGVLSLDLATALYPLKERPLLTSFMAGMGGEAVPTHEFQWMAEKLQKAAREGRVEKMAHWVGFEE